MSWLGQRRKKGDTAISQVYYRYSRDRSSALCLPNNVYADGGIHSFMTNAFPLPCCDRRKHRTVRSTSLVSTVARDYTGPLAPRTNR